MFTAPLPTEGIDALLDELSTLLERLETSDLASRTNGTATPVSGSMMDESPQAPILTWDVAATVLARLRHAEGLFREIGDRRGMAVAAAR